MLPSVPRFDRQALRRGERRWPAIWRASLRFAAVVPAILLLLGVASAQEEKPKIPGLDKIISANEHLAFTGTIKLVDEKHNTLSVNSVEGVDTEIFPIKHSTHVVTADGFKKKLEDLSPGTQVIVFYDQRADHRTVTSIQLLASKYKKKTPPS